MSVFAYGSCKGFAPLLAYYHVTSDNNIKIQEDVLHALIRGLGSRRSKGTTYLLFSKTDADVTR